MVCNWAGEEFQPEFNPLPMFQGDHACKPNRSSTSSRQHQKIRMQMLTGDHNGRPMAFFVPWSDHTLFLHPKESKIAGRSMGWREGSNNCPGQNKGNLVLVIRGCYSQLVEASPR